MRTNGWMVFTCVVGAGLLMGRVTGAGETKGDASGKAVAAVAEKKADEAVIKEALDQEKKERETKTAEIIAKLPAVIQDRMAYREAMEKWDAAACRKELEAVISRRGQVGNELEGVPEKIRLARKAAVESNPEIKALNAEITEKQALLKKKVESLQAVKSLVTKDEDLRKEEQEIEWKRQTLYYRLVKLGENPAQAQPKPKQDLTTTK